MKRFRTLTTVTISDGEVGLTDAQYARRSAQLRKVKAGVYEVMQPVQFKTGEEVALSGVPKSDAERYEEVTESAKKAVQQ